MYVELRYITEFILHQAHLQERSLRLLYRGMKTVIVGHFQVEDLVEEMTKNGNAPGTLTLWQILI